MNKYHAQVQNSQLTFGSEHSKANFRQFLKDNEGAFVTIEPRQKITKESRGYFEGALCPSFVKWQAHNPHDKTKLEEAREVFKLEFNSGIAIGLDGNPVKIPLSTAKLSKTEFRDNFIADIVDYFAENKIPVPSPELYKAWRDIYSSNDPLLTFWEWLEKYNLKCDSEVSDIKIEVPTYKYPTK